MGLDYIREQTGKPWRKRWNGGLDRLKSPKVGGVDPQIGGQCPRSAGRGTP
jgi:hypothetical protein